MDNPLVSRDHFPGPPAAEVLALVERLAARPPARVSDVESITGHALRHVGLANENYDVYAAEAVAPFTRIEWRTPASARATGGNLLLLSLTQGGCIEGSSVTARFGIDLDDLRPPAPSGHHDVDAASGDANLVYYVYRKHWGTLSFGIRRGPPECLQTVVLSIQMGQ